MKTFGSLLFLMLVIASCRQPKELVYQDVQNFNIKHAGLRNTTLSMDVRLYNPNNYKLKLKKSDIDVYINGSLLGKINIEGGIDISKRDTSALPVMLDVDLGNALPNMLQLLVNNEVNIKLSGSIKAGRHGLYVKVPVNYEGKQDIFAGLK
jgi:LEA14-like dessication related protein